MGEVTAALRRRLAWMTWTMAARCVHVAGRLLPADTPLRHLAVTMAAAMSAVGFEATQPVARVVALREEFSAYADVA